MKKEIHVLYVLTKLELGGAQKVCLSLLKGTSQPGVENDMVSSSLLSGSEGVLVPEAKKIKCESVYLLKSFKREVGIKTFFYEFKAFFEFICGFMEQFFSRKTISKPAKIHNRKQ